MDDTARQGAPAEEARPTRRAFLFLVNPKLHYDPYPDWAKWLPIVDGGGAIDMQWNTGSRRSGMEPGDLALLVKVGVAPRGLVALGKVTSTIYEGPHWNPDAARPVTGWVDIRLTALLDLDDPLPLSVLKEIGPGIRWTPRMSGVEVPIDVGEEVRGLVMADV